MLIVCPDCSTSYQVEAASLGESGRSVRCARCQTEWFAEARKALMVLEGTAAYEEPPIRHDEWWGGDSAREAEPEPSAAAGEWAITREGPPEITDGPDRHPPADVPDLHLPADERITIEAPPLVPAVQTTDEALHHDLDHDAAIDVETVAARGAKLAVAPPPRRKRWAPSLPAAAMILVAVLAGLVAGRAQVVRQAPQSAALYNAVGLPVNLRGLDFKDVRISGETEDDVPVLVVQGTIVNSVKRPVEVPRMRFALLNPSGLETYAWTAMPARTVLGEGETLAFRSRLASPPPDIRDVQVRFSNRRDRAAGR